VPAPAPEPQLVFVSRFGEAAEGGVQAFHLNPRTGDLKPLRQSGEGRIFFLTLARDGSRLYGLRACEAAQEDEVIAWEITNHDGDLRELGRARTGGRDSCHVTLDPTGRWLLIANYTGGTLATIPLKSDGAPSDRRTLIRLRGSSVHPRQTEPHPHSFVTAFGMGDRLFAYAADLGSDRIWGFDFDVNSGTCKPLDPPFCSTPSGAGPRHLAMHPGRRCMYAVNELSSSVTIYNWDPHVGTLSARQTVGALPGDFAGESYGGDLAITPDGRSLFVSNRGHDSISCFAIGPNGELGRQDVMRSGGKYPQSLALCRKGRWLFCAHILSGELTLISVEQFPSPRAVKRVIKVGGASCVVAHCGDESRFRL
jgi:6-phosphogluconolactonase